MTITLTIDGLKHLAKYTGELDRSNKATGIGVAEFSDQFGEKKVYYGTFKENRLHGIATLNDSETFEFRDGKKHGKSSRFIFEG